METSKYVKSVLDLYHQAELTALLRMGAKTTRISAPDTEITLIDRYGRSLPGEVLFQSL